MTQGYTYIKSMEYTPVEICLPRDVLVFDDHNSVWKIDDKIVVIFEFKNVAVFFR